MIFKKDDLVTCLVVGVPVTQCCKAAVIFDIY